MGQLITPTAKVPHAPAKIVDETRRELLRALFGPEIPDNDVHCRVAAWTNAAALNTLRAMRSDLRIIDAHQQERSRATLPLSPADMYELVSGRADQGRSKSTIDRLVASAVRIHALAGLPACIDDMVKWKLKQIRRADHRSVRQARGLRLKGDTLDVVDGDSVGPSLLGLLASIPGDPQGLRDRALLSTGYDAGMRRSELVRVAVCDIEILANGEASLFIPRSKTDQVGEGARAWLSRRAVDAVLAWTSAAEISEGFVFRSLSYRVGAAGMLSEGSVPRILKKRLKAYLDDLIAVGSITADDRDEIIRDSSGHSLRVGCNQDLFAAGLDIGAIMQGLRWTSPKQPLAYARHLAPATSKLANLMRRVNTFGECS